MLLDSIAALTFILLIGMLIVHLYQPKMSQTSIVAYKNMHYISEDILDVLNKKGVLDDIGTEWAVSNGSTNSTHFENATNITKEYMGQLIPPNMGYRVTVDETVIYDSDEDNTSNRIRESDSTTKTYASRLLVGYAAGLPTVGHIARSFLTNILEKETSEYAYFGGFVGQGNLTRSLILPASMDSVKQAYVEMAAGSEFELFVDDLSCGTFTPSLIGENITANIKEYILTPGNCFSSGDNEIEIRFTGSDLSEQYIGGGFVRVTYNTSEMDTSPASNTDRYYFSGIDGLINLYSSFYVPGILNSMTIHLEFLNNYTTYLTVGDTSVLNTSGSESNQTFDLNDTYLQGVFGGYPAIFSENTIPIRMGLENVSYITNVTGNADVILITDLSGSMSWCLDGETKPWKCTDVNGSNPQRLELAKKLDKEFVDIILNGSGNRLGLVSYSTSLGITHDLSTNPLSLKTQIDLYSAGGGTCVCCALRQARLMLEGQSNDSRQKFIITMTDGIPNQKCDLLDENDTSGSNYCYCCEYSYGGGDSHPDCLGSYTYAACDDVWYANWWWDECCDSQAGWCSSWVTGWYDSDCGDIIDSLAISQAINDSCKANNDVNATVHSIGFIDSSVLSNCPDSNTTLQEIASCGNGSSYASTNVTELEDIYRTLAQGLVNMSYKAQIGLVTGDITISRLYPESYIEFNYTPAASNLSVYGEITLTQDTELFNESENCTGNVFVTERATVTDARVTSYSAEHWTHELYVRGSRKYYLGDYGSDYLQLGDPYVVQIPNPLVNLIPGQENEVIIKTADSPGGDTGCSTDDKAIYTIRLQTGVGYGGVFTEREGCIWNIQFEDDTEMNVSVPGNYTGTDECSYREGNITDNSPDAIDDAIYRLLLSLDSNENNKLDIKFESSMLEFSFTRSGGVRSLWGPADFKLIMWM